MTILLADPRVHATLVQDNGDPLVPVDFAPDVRVRAGLAARLASARAALPGGVDLRVVEGHRSTADQQEIFEEYTDTLRVRYPGVDAVATA